MRGRGIANFNREERALCAHLFRLLHEGLSAGASSCPLREVLRGLAGRGLRFEGGGAVELGTLSVDGGAVLAEVALIRHA